ncbi:hypothetical protein D3C84_984240 [compost metagenome]
MNTLAAHLLHKLVERNPLLEHILLDKGSFIDKNTPLPVNEIAKLPALHRHKFHCDGYKHPHRQCHQSQIPSAIRIERYISRNIADCDAGDIFEQRQLRYLTLA